MSKNYGARYRPVTLQTAAVATGNGTAIKVTDPFLGAEAILVLQVEGITTGTITFEGTINGTDWTSVAALAMVDGSTLATTATADGIFKINVRGLAQVRARVSAWTSGSFNVTGNLVSVS